MRARHSSVRLFSLLAVALGIAVGSTTSTHAQSGGGTPPGAGASPKAAVGPIVALEVPSPNHVLKKTYFKTQNTGFLNLSTTWQNAFSDTVVACPGGSGTCAIAVTVSSQFGAISGTEVARARVYVNGVLTAPGDSCCLNFSRNAGQLPQTNTMTFVANNVPAGNRVVRVQFAVSGGATGYADYRTLEIRVFKP